MRTLLGAAVAASLLIAAGCNNAKSPDGVSNDVAKAEQKGAAEVAKSEDSAAKNLDSAAGKVDDKLVDFNNQAAKDAYNITIAKADAQLKVSQAKCEALAGTPQKNCNDQAQADYDASKAEAKAAAQASKQPN
jgi:hypothetical protein